jgi:drug/metabolite transporter (DMT)-like permease
MGWSAGLVGLKSLLHEVGPLDIAIIRLLIVGGLALVTIPLLRGSRPGAQTLPRIAVLALLGGVVSTLAPTVALQWVPVSTVSVAIAANPLVTVVLARLLLNERLDRRKIVGLALATTGFAAIIGLPKPSRVDDISFAIGLSVVLVGQVCFSLFFVLARRQLRSLGPLALIAYVSAASAAMIVPLTPVLGDRALAAVASPAILLLLFVALVHYVGQLAWLVALRHVEVSVASLYLLLLPVFASAQAIVLLGETITPGLLVGGSAVLAGIAISSGGKGSRPLPDAAPLMG